ncbi:MAG: DUF3987 domain-containing protein [Pyrinomonadaceae bacterium]
MLDGNWLQYYAEYVKESESPDIYHLWTALSSIASAVRRNVWLNQGTYILYPNMYVVLIGPPGRVRKSTTIRLGRRLLYDVEGIHFGPDSVTREDLISQLAKISLNSKQAALTIHSTELSSLIEPSGIKMIQFLTDIFDGDVKWRYSTKGQGKYTINNPVLNILAGTTPTWIADGLPPTVIGHGFTSRVVFVYANDRRYLRPFPNEPDPNLVKALSLDLDHISRLEGEFTWGPGAKDCYNKIYEKIDKSRPRDYRVEGFHNRKDIYVLKVAMLLSIAENDSLILRAVDLDAAFDALNTIEESMHHSFSAVGKYEHAADYERLLAALAAEGGEMTSEEIYDRFHAVGDVNEIGAILNLTLSTGKVERLVKKGKPTVYRLRRKKKGQAEEDPEDSDLEIPLSGPAD